MALAANPIQDGGIWPSPWRSLESHTSLAELSPLAGAAGIREGGRPADNSSECGMGKLVKIVVEKVSLCAYTFTVSLARTLSFNGGVCSSVHTKLFNANNSVMQLLPVTYFHAQPCRVV